MLRALIPARWRRPLTSAPVHRAPVTGHVESLSVRPPWWRMAAGMLIRRRTHARQDLGVSTPVASAEPAPLRASRPLVTARPTLLRANAPRAAAEQPMLRSRPPVVSATPSLVSRVDSSPAAAALPSMGAPVGSPVQLWRAAVSRVPLESPRPFPTELRPLVADLTGSADRPSYTTGPATRSALRAAGAVGATTGTVVHLPEMPSNRPDRIGVLAHELSHARNPVTRPRFLLRAPGGGMDADERIARSVGSRVHRAVTMNAPASTGNTASTGNLASTGNPVSTGSLGSTVAVVSAVRSATAARSATLGPQIARMATGAPLVVRSGPSLVDVPGSAPAVARAARLDHPVARSAGAGPVMRAVSNTRLDDAAQAITAVVDEATDTVTNAGQRARQTGTIAAGIVDTLPVGGAAAAGLADTMRPAGLPSPAALSGGALPGSMPGADSVSDTVLSAAPAAEQQVIEFAAPAAAGGDAAGAPGAASAIGSASTAAAGLTSAVAGAAGQAAGTAPGGVSSVTPADIDKITAALEERLLRQLERRGGRYAGVF